MARARTFRVGRVTVYLRGTVWYLRYHEHGQRHQVRGAAEKEAARQLAAQVNAQLETGAPAMTSFEPIGVGELRKRWLDHHEHVLRSSVATINRYRTASDHLLNFIRDQQPIRCASHLRPTHTEAFVRYLRELEIAPNGHANTARRKLRDKGLRFVLEVCRTMYNFAVKRRHLPPYGENPFSVIDIDRIPIEDAKPIIILSGDQEKALLEACDDWQFPIFLTLMLTGMRPGELTHLLLPEDLDLAEGSVFVRNKPSLGWQVKTRSERRIPLVPELVDVLRIVVGQRAAGPVFLRRCCQKEGYERVPLLGQAREQLEIELARRVEQQQRTLTRALTRAERQRLCHRIWVEAGAIEPEVLRVSFMQLTKAIGQRDLTAPKVLRHGFATVLQDANVDPLIRSQLMGHASACGPDRSKGPLGMTGTYTHSKPETVRRQLFEALGARPIIAVVRDRLGEHSKSDAQA